MANWTNTSKAYLSGTITSSLVLDSANVAAGSIPSSWNTYNDGTYNDSTYTPTACFNGQVDSGIGRPRMFLAQAGGSGDIKYRFRTSPTGTVWGSWSLLTNTYGKEYIDADNRWIDLEVIYYSPLWSDSDYFGIQTIGAQFIRFNKYETIYAEDMNSNFNYLGGNRLPYGGLYLLPTTSVYNLGSDVYRWNNIYTYSVTTTYIETSSQYRLYKKISDVQLSVLASSIEISGLNLDYYNHVIIYCNLIASTMTSSSVQFNMIINGDSSSNYGYQQTIFDTNTSISSTRGTQTSFNLANANTISSYLNMSFFTKNGINRSLISNAHSGILGIYGKGVISGQVWNDTTSTITSLKIYSNVVNGIATGSSIKIFGKY